MPLVVPGINSTGDQSQSWMAKLAGKSLGNEHSEQTFAQKDLPPNHRVIQDGGVQTLDHDANRMNIYVANDGTVRKVDFQ